MWEGAARRASRTEQGAPSKGISSNRDIPRSTPSTRLAGWTPFALVGGLLMHRCASKSPDPPSGCASRTCESIVCDPSYLTDGPCPPPQSPMVERSQGPSDRHSPRHALRHRAPCLWMPGQKRPQIVLASLCSKTAVRDHPPICVPSPAQNLSAASLMGEDSGDRDLDEML